MAGLPPCEVCHSTQGVGLGDSKPPGRIAFLGDFPPRLCGIATFTKDLCEAVVAAAPDSQCFEAAVSRLSALLRQVHMPVVTTLHTIPHGMPDVGFMESADFKDQFGAGVS